MSHPFEFPEETLSRIMARRGKLHLYEHFDASKTALVVIDMQNAFMMEGVAAAPCAMAREIVPHINHMAQALRAKGGHVYWIQNTHSDTTLQDWSAMYEVLTPARRAARIANMSPGSLGHAFWSKLDIEPTDQILPKTRYSAFLPGYCDLPEQLRAKGIENVLISGTITNTCCESSARDAMMLNFRTVMLSDANAAHNDFDHMASLAAFFLNFGDVMAVNEVIDRLG